MYEPSAYNFLYFKSNVNRLLFSCLQLFFYKTLFIIICLNIWKFCHLVTTQIVKLRIKDIQRHAQPQLGQVIIQQTSLWQPLAGADRKNRNIEHLSCATKL